MATNNFKFDDVGLTTTTDMFVAELGEMKTPDDDFETYCKELQFPFYFGFNWNALWDCLCSLDGIEQKNVCLVHKTMPALFRDAMILYLEILHNAVDNWILRPGDHLLNVYFPSCCENRIMHYLKDVKQYEM